MPENPAAWARYKLRLRRKRLLWRALSKRHEITATSRKTGAIVSKDVLLFAVMRNEMHRLPHFLSHYRALGVGHFLIIDNNSDDGTGDFLAAQPDVSVWQSKAGYKASRFGMDWLTCLLWRYGHGHWTVTVDADELFIYPDWEQRNLHTLTQALSRQGLVAMGALMLELYPKGPISDQTYRPGQDPTEVLNWFDAYGYFAQLQPKLGNLWLQGGPRARVFFADDARRAPTLNKIPLMRWNRNYVYVNSTHNALPRTLNRVYDQKDAVKPWGALLHTKFLPDAIARAKEEKHRGEHFADAVPYQGYYDALAANPDLWCDESISFENADQLERLGLISRGHLTFE